MIIIVIVIVDVVCFFSFFDMRVLFKILKNKNEVFPKKKSSGSLLLAHFFQTVLIFYFVLNFFYTPTKELIVSYGLCSCCVLARHVMRLVVVSNMEDPSWFLIRKPLGLYNPNLGT